MGSSHETPVYLNLVNTLRAGYTALDVAIQNEIKNFIEGQQHKNGGFIDRAGNSDLYYSLFGLWLSIASDQTELHVKLNDYLQDIESSASDSVVEDLAQVLIQTHLDQNKTKKSILSILSRVRKKGASMDLSYQFFLISLVVDAVGKNRKLYYFFARLCLYFYKPKGNIPCSVAAALIYARKFLGLNTRKKEMELRAFNVERGGFKAFMSMEHADSLSTGVALFVLKELDADIRLMRPGCLEFIQANYDGGAFLSGDGDLTRDLEYTFYGLLALGALVQNEG